MPNNTQSDTEETSSGQPGLSLPSIARTVWKRKVPVVSVWIVLSLATAIIVRQLPSVYVAQSLILVDSQKIPEKFVSATVATDLEDRVAAIREQILSSGALKKIIDDFNLYQKERKTRFEEEILELMRQDTSIALVPVGTGRDARPGAFRIGYQGPDPTVVARVANRLTDLYVEQNLKTREAQAEGTSEFLGTQVQEAKKHLDDLETAVTSYKLKHTGELPQQEAALTAALANLHTRLQANMDAINRAQQTKIILESTLGSLEASEAAQVRALEPGQVALASTSAPAPRKKSEILQERLDLLLTQYVPTFPDVVTVRKALEDAKRQEAEQQAKGSAPAAPGAKPVITQELERTREQITGLKAQIKVQDTELANRAADQKTITRLIDSYQGRIEHLPERELDMAQLTRDYEMSKDNYKSLLEKQTGAAMSLDMERRQQSERFTILDRASVPEKPVKPNRPLYYALGSAGALALGLLVAFVVELRKDVFLGEWELPEGTTVLARLPFIEVASKSAGSAPPPGGKWLRRRKTIAAASAGLLCLTGLLARGIASVFDGL